MFNTRNLKRNTKAGHQSQRLQSVDATIRIRAANH